MAWGKVISAPIKNVVKETVQEITGNPTVAACAAAATGAIVSHVVQDHCSAALEHVEMIAVITEIDIEVG